MVKCKELIDGVRADPDSLEMAISDKFYDRDYQCAFYAKDCELIFDERNQLLQRYNDDNFLVATKDVTDLDSAIRDVIEFGNKGEITDEEPY